MPGPIRSCVRLRPLAASESSAFALNGNRISVEREALAREGRADWLADSEFQFHSIFGGGVRTEELYVCAVSDVLHRALESGDNCAVIAYGQTGSGKTFTMLGDASAAANCDGAITFPSDEKGVVTLAVLDVLRLMSRGATVRRHRLCISCVEVYNEQCNDCLLYTSPSPRDQRGSRMPSSA